MLSFGELGIRSQALEVIIMANKLNKIKTQLLWEHGRYCAICGKRIRSFDDLTVDHIIPTSKGGKSEIDNCQLAHRACNSMKKDLMPDVYAWRSRHNKRLLFLAKLRRIMLMW